jgi:hypothetical protein
MPFSYGEPPPWWGGSGVVDERGRARGRREAKASPVATPQLDAHYMSYRQAPCTGA